MSSAATLSKRERQIMDVLYRLEQATAADIRAAMGGGLNDSTVRTQLRVLEEKGHVRHDEQGLRYVYSPTVSKYTARKSALKHVVDTFFDGSRASVVSALLGPDGSRLSNQDLDRIAALIEAARKGER